MVALGLESVLGTDNAASMGGPILAKTKVRRRRAFLLSLVVGR